MVFNLVHAACRGWWGAYMVWEAYCKSRSWWTIPVSPHWHCCGEGCSEHLDVDLGRVEFLVLEKVETYLPHYFGDLPVATGEYAPGNSGQL